MIERSLFQRSTYRKFKCCYNKLKTNFSSWKIVKLSFFNIYIHISIKRAHNPFKLIFTPSKLLEDEHFHH